MDSCAPDWRPTRSKASRNSCAASKKWISGTCSRSTPPSPTREVEVTDADAKAFYKVHKGDAQYAQQAGRDIEYIRIPLTASFDDRQRAQTAFEQYQKDWTNAEVDSAFLAGNV